MKLEYRIIEASSAATLEERITMLLSNGWKLQGGICVNRDLGNRTVYYQAVSK
jgi:hypothetical protein